MHDGPGHFIYTRTATKGDRTWTYSVSVSLNSEQQSPYPACADTGRLNKNVQSLQQKMFSSVAWMGYDI